MPPSQVRHYQSSSHKLLQLFSICVFTIGCIPSLYCFLVSCEGDKRELAWYSTSGWWNIFLPFQGELVGGKNRLSYLPRHCRLRQFCSGYITKDYGQWIQDTSLPLFAVSINHSCSVFWSDQLQSKTVILFKSHFLSPFNSLWFSPSAWFMATEWECQYPQHDCLCLCFMDK